MEIAPINTAMDIVRLNKDYLRLANAIGHEFSCALWCHLSF